MHIFIFLRKVLKFSEFLVTFQNFKFWGVTNLLPLNESHPRDSNLKILPSILLLSSMVLIGPKNLGVSLPRTLKHHKPLIGVTLRYT
jgi:hypothetical protein